VIALYRNGHVEEAGTIGLSFAKERPLAPHFSVAQIYNLVWSAARDAAAFYQRGGVIGPVV
jgi:hypothetical protein